MELKDRIAQAMKNAGMSQADLCRATNMGSSKVSQILKGKVADPRLSTTIKIADALGVSLDYLAGREDLSVTSCAYNSDESALLDNYRAASPDGRAAISQMARFACGQSQEAHGISSEREAM